MTKVPRAPTLPPLPIDWVHRPQQDRSRRTLERLLDATEELIREKGVDAVTVPAVALAAGSSVGSFYGRFADKAALLATLHERACAQTIATLDAALDPALFEKLSTEELVRAFVSFSVRLMGQRRSMMLAFGAALAGDPGFALRRARTAAAIGARVSRLLLLRRGAIAHPDPAVAVGICLRVVTATLEQRVSLESVRVPEVAISDDDLVAELARMVLAYLGIKAHPKR